MASNSDQAVTGRLPGVSGHPWSPQAQPPRLESGEAHVWRVRVAELKAREDAWLAVLSPTERERVDRKRRPEDRRREWVSRAGARWLLAGYTGVPAAELAFATEQRGKPVLVTPPEGGERIEFNSSHSGDWVLLAFARGHAVGVDVEGRRELEHDDLVRNFFAPLEQAQWQRIDPAARPGAFFDAWTRKEAYLKALGVGLMKPLASFAVQFEPGTSPALLTCDEAAAVADWRFFDVSPEVGYHGALVAPVAVRRVRTFTLRP